MVPVPHLTAMSERLNWIIFITHESEPVSMVSNNEGGSSIRARHDQERRRNTRQTHLFSRRMRDASPPPVLVFVNEPIDLIRDMPCGLVTFRLHSNRMGVLLVLCNLLGLLPAAALISCYMRSSEGGMSPSLAQLVVMLHPAHIT